MPRLKRPHSPQRLRSPNVFYGGKYRSAQHIVPLFADHTTYVEPFAGGLNVLWYKTPSPVEIVGDLNPHLINFYQMLQTQPDRFLQRVRGIPYCRDSYDAAVEGLKAGDAFERAVGYYITGRMSYSGWRKSYRPDRSGKPGLSKQSDISNAAIYAGSVAQLPRIIERLSKCRIYCRDACELIRRYDAEETLLYCDPPYLHETRSPGTTDGVYHKDMTDSEHEELLEVLLACRGAVYLSGYDNDLYNRILSGWRRTSWNTKTTCATPCGAKKRKGARTEILWWNGRAAAPTVATPPPWGKSVAMCAW